mmetsp:Transcript_11355/g.32240  ORF Transcript_11355/g.32240 Transcript_11355/m.32240 type:complete len:217 (+) Transcript_11355:702-1352(+)
MSNCETIMLPILEVESHQIREVLRCILHTVVFNRALGCVRPVDMESDLFDISYVQCGDSYVARSIEEKITACSAWMEKNPGKLVQVNLSFFNEKRKKQAWFGRQGERLYWEQWCIPLSQINPIDSRTPQRSPPLGQAPSSPDGASRKAELEAALEETLTLIVSAVNTKRDHIPPVVSAEMVAFPYEISVSGSETTATGFDMVKKMLLQTTPPSVLG